MTYSEVHFEEETYLEVPFFNLFRGSFDEETYLEVQFDEETY